MPDLFDKRLVFVTGKGGVGKSTVSLALGLAAARMGKRTIVCEVSGQEKASSVFKVGTIGFNEVKVDDNLWAISIDTEESLREYLLLQLKVRAMRDLLMRSRIFTYLAAATPGLKELVAIGKIWELAQDDRQVKKAGAYDLVIVDAPATGHGVGFLSTPRTFADIARVGPVHSQAETLDAYLRNHETTGVAIVALPEEMPVNETASLERQLTGEVGMEVDRVFMNAMYPERFTEDEASKLSRVLELTDGAANAAVRAALSQQRRRAAQVEQLERLERRTRTPISVLPFVFEPRLNVPELRALSEVVL